MRSIVLLIVGIALLGCARVPQVPKSVVEFRLGESHPGTGLTLMSIPGSGSTREVFVRSIAVLTNADIASAQVKKISGRQFVYLRFTTAGAKQLSAVTAANIGKPLCMFVNGKLVSVPIIKTNISGGRATIVLDSAEEAERVANAFK